MADKWMQVFDLVRAAQGVEGDVAEAAIAADAITALFAARTQD